MQRSNPAPSGTLYKLSPNSFRGRAWNKRFFVFSGQTLAYYTTQEAYERQERPRKVVDLSNCRVEDTGMEQWSSKARPQTVGGTSHGAAQRAHSRSALHSRVYQSPTLHRVQQ
jgi:PH domain